MARWSMLAIAGLGAAVIALLALPLGPTLRIAHREGLYGPAFSLDGKSVYFVHRDCWGAWYANLAPTWTPFGDGLRVTSLVISDHVTLRRVDRERKSVELVEDWPATPLNWSLGQSARAALFGYLRAVLNVSEARGVEYALSLTPPDGEGVRYGLSGRWDEEARAVVESAGWRERGQPAGDMSAPLLHGDWELFTLPGEPLFPAAIVAFNHVTDEVEPLVALGSALRDPTEASAAHLRGRSRRAEIERRAAIARAREEARRYFARFGLGANEIELRATRELRRQGLLPKEDALVAGLLAGTASEADDLPLFEITETELASGIFEDIKLAISAPGIPVRGPRAEYSSYGGFTTAERLNAYLAAGGTAFRVGYGRRTFLVRLVPGGFPPPAGLETLTARLASTDDALPPGTLVIDVEPGASDASRYPDILAALASPGTPVAKQAEPYVVTGEGDWATRQLNRYLFDGSKRFRARFRGRLYTFSIEAARQ